METLTQVAVENGIQFVLSLMWIIVLSYVLKNAKPAGIAVLEHLERTNAIIRENSDLLEFTKELHEKMVEADIIRHETLMDRVDSAINEIKVTREIYEESGRETSQYNIKTAASLERIERALKEERKEMIAKQGEEEDE